jgi:glyoxylase-like metal-dependent hydrolase (beta-lactamase superfamily II)
MPIGAQADPLQDADAALGASTLHTLTFTAIGMRSQFSQGLWTAESYLPVRAIKSYQADIDFDSSALRVESVTVTSPSGGFFVGDQHALELLSDGFTWSASDESVGRPPDPSRPASQPQPNALTDRLYWLWTATPQGALKAAGSAVGREVPGGTEVSYTVAGRHVTVFINQLHQLERAETLIPDPLLGDTRLLIRYSGYRDFGGLLFPSLISEYEDDLPVISLSVTGVQINPALASITVPENVRSFTAPARIVKLQSLAEGVYWITGATHNSMLIDMGKYLVMVEAPLNEARSGAVIAETKKRFPGKPIRYVINTHVHSDHSGGLRTYVDAGAIVVTESANRAFYERAWAEPRTLEPDRLSKSARPARFLTVDDHLQIKGTQRRTIELFHLQGNPHNEESLVAWLPNERILFEADMLNGRSYGAPEQHPSPALTNFYDNLERLHIQPLQIVGVHGSQITTMSDLSFAVGKPAPR